MSEANLLPGIFCTIFICNTVQKIPGSRLASDISVREDNLVKFAHRMVCLYFNHIQFALKLKALDRMLSSFDDVDPDHFVGMYVKKDVGALLIDRSSHSVRMETNPIGKR